MGLTLGFNIAFGPTREPFVTDGVFLHEDLSRHLESAWGNEIDYVSEILSQKETSVSI
jgi:hypothetical protein